jgi:hypothetical protein
MPTADRVAVEVAKIPADLPDDVRAARVAAIEGVSN